jgi:hypothetical protein
MTYVRDCTYLCLDEFETCLFELSLLVKDAAVADHSVGLVLRTLVDERLGGGKLVLLVLD